MAEDDDDCDVDGRLMCTAAECGTAVLAARSEPVDTERPCAARALAAALVSCSSSASIPCGTDVVCTSRPEEAVDRGSPDGPSDRAADSS